MSLSTEKRISRNNWTEIPMPADIIQRVHALAGSTASNHLTFGDRNNTDMVEDGEHDYEEESVGSNSSDESDDNTGNGVVQEKGTKYQGVRHDRITRFTNETEEAQPEVPLPTEEVDDHNIRGATTGKDPDDEGVQDI